MDIGNGTPAAPSASATVVMLRDSAAGMEVFLLDSARALGSIGRSVRISRRQGRSRGPGTCIAARPGAGGSSWSARRTVAGNSPCRRGVCRRDPRGLRGSRRAVRRLAGRSRAKLRWSSTAPGGRSMKSFPAWREPWQLPRCSLGPAGLRRWPACARASISTRGSSLRRCRPASKLPMTSAKRRQASGSRRRPPCGSTGKAASSSPRHRS
jgi:hypothetical protein